MAHTTITPRQQVSLLKALLFTIICTAASATGALTPEQIGKQIESLYWMTEQYPPFNYVDEADGELKGITVDILMAMFERANVDLTPDDLHVLPWQRSYQALLDEPNTVLFSTTYTVERLQHFRFVGPVIPTRISVIAPKSKGLVIESIADLDALRIGTIRDDIGDQLLRELGVDESAIQQKPTPAGLVQMLAAGRLDAIAYAEDIAQYQFTKARIDPDDYAAIHVLQQSHMGYAFHIGTDPRVLEPLRKALDELRADGTIDRIYDRYLHHATTTYLGGLR
jgi:polar amino acid transport system substrate-binding protein